MKSLILIFSFTSTFYLPLHIIDFFKYFKRELKPDLILGLAHSSHNQWWMVLRDLNANASRNVGLRSFRYQRFDTRFFLIYVYIVICTWFKERRIFTQNVFHVHPETLKLELIEFMVQYHCLSSYRKDLYRNNFVSKRQNSGTLSRLRSHCT